MKQTIFYGMSVGILIAGCGIHAGSSHKSFKDIERSIKMQRDIRDKLENKRIKLAATMARKEGVVGEQLAMIENDRKTLAALDAEIAEAGAILRDLGMQQSHMMEQIQDEKMASHRQVQEALSGGKRKRS